MPFFSTAKTKLYEPPTSAEARKRLYRMGIGEAPEQPVQEIAGAVPLEEMAYQAAQRNLGATPWSYDTALGLTKGMTAETDPTQAPGFAGTWAGLLQGGVTQGRNLQRALKLSGNAATQTSKGRQMVGNQVTGAQEALLAGVLPFYGAERERRLAAAEALPQIEQAKEQSQANWAQVGANTGAMMQAIEQATKDAQMQAQMRDLEYKYQLQPGYLQSILTAPTLQMEQDPGFTGRTHELSEAIEMGKNIPMGSTQDWQGLGSMMQTQQQQPQQGQQAQPISWNWGQPGGGQSYGSLYTGSSLGGLGENYGAMSSFYGY